MDRDTREVDKTYDFKRYKYIFIGDFMLITG